MSTIIKAIDVHGHYGICAGQKCSLTNTLMTGAPSVVTQRARKASIALTFVSPMASLTRDVHGNAEAGNLDCARVVRRYHSLRQWVVVDPLAPRTFDQAAGILAGKRCVGIKIHPELHGYPIRKHGHRIFAFAEKHDAIVISHSGQERSLPLDFVRLVNDFPDVPLILGHLGYGFDTDVTHQVRAIQQSRHGNMYVDTSSSMSIIPNLIEWAVREIGAERILFGTDTPVYFAPMQRARIDAADIPMAVKRRILRDNAVVLFMLELTQGAA